MNPYTTIKLNIDQIDQIVVNELQIAYELERTSCEQIDTELLLAIERLLQYFMSPSEYTNWKKEIENKKL